VITEIAGEAVRFPWTTCPFAAGQLTGIVGMPLSTRSTAVGARVDPRANCTHLFDLAGLAVAHAGAGRDRRVYDAVVPDRVEGVSRVTLARDGEPLLAWTADGRTIVEPEPFAGRSMREGFLAWAEHAFPDDDEHEAVVVLRRACAISWGRIDDLDKMETAEPLLPVMAGACYTFQPDRMPIALRMKGSTRDFTGHPERLLASGS
jgi:hypothetical protein